MRPVDNEKKNETIHKDESPTLDDEIRRREKMGEEGEKKEIEEKVWKKKIEEER